jgi:hypothetical protein
MHLLILTIMIFLSPSIAQALCLENCRQEAAAIHSYDDFGDPNARSQNAGSGNRNIRAGDAKNSVFGDMNIRVGHERVDVRTESASSNNTIDASIYSTIVLGDMNK